MLAKAGLWLFSDYATSWSLASAQADPEEVEEDAQDREGRDGDDYAEDTGEAPADYDGQEHHDRVNMQGVSLYLRCQEIALELLYGKEQQRHPQCGRRRDCERHQQRGYRADPGPYSVLR